MFRAPSGLIIVCTAGVAPFQQPRMVGDSQNQVNPDEDPPYSRLFVTCPPHYTKGIACLHQLLCLTAHGHLSLLLNPDIGINIVCTYLSWRLRVSVGRQTWAVLCQHLHLSVSWFWNEYFIYLGFYVFL